MLNVLILGCRKISPVGNPPSPESDSAPPDRPKFRSFSHSCRKFRFCLSFSGVFSWNCGRGSRPCPTQSARPASLCHPTLWAPYPPHLGPPLGLLSLPPRRTRTRTKEKSQKQKRKNKSWISLVQSQLYDQHSRDSGRREGLLVWDVRCCSSFEKWSRGVRCKCSRSCVRDMSGKLVLPVSLWKDELNCFSFFLSCSHRRTSTGEVSLLTRNHERETSPLNCY